MLRAGTTLLQNNIVAISTGSRPNGLRLAQDAAHDLLHEQTALVLRAVQHAAVLLSPAEKVGDCLPNLAVRNVLVRLRGMGGRPGRRRGVCSVSAWP